MAQQLWKPLPLLACRFVVDCLTYAVINQKYDAEIIRIPGLQSNSFCFHVRIFCIDRLQLFDVRHAYFDKMVVLLSLAHFTPSQTHHEVSTFC